MRCRGEGKPSKLELRKSDHGIVLNRCHCERRKVQLNESDIKSSSGLVDKVQTNDSDKVQVSFNGVQSDRRQRGG